MHRLVMIVLAILPALLPVGPTLAEAPVDSSDRLLDLATHLRLRDFREVDVGSLELLEGEDVRAADVAHYLRGAARYELGQLDTSGEDLGIALLSQHSVVSRLARLRLAEVQWRAGRIREAVSLLVDLPPWPLGSQLERRTLALWVELAQIPEEAELRGNVLSMLRSSGLADSEKKAHIIRVNSAAGKPVDIDCEALADRFPCQPLPPVCQPLRASGDRAAPGFLLRRARDLVECRDYPEAVRLLEEVLASRKGKALHEEAMWQLARVHHRKLRDNLDGAYRLYEKVYKTTHSARRKEEALYQMGRCRMNSEDYPAALTLFARHLKEFPRSRNAEQSSYYLGWLHYDGGALKPALQGFLAYLERFPKGSMRWFVMVFAGDVLLRLQRYRDAVEQFSRPAHSAPESQRQRARYWTGRALLDRGKKTRAKETWRGLWESSPLSWYGVLANRRLLDLGEEPSDLFAGLHFSAPPRATTAMLAKWVPARQHPAMEEVLDAVDCGEPELARRLFEGLEEDFLSSVPTDSRPEVVGILGELLERPDWARAWGRRHLPARGTWPDEGSFRAHAMEYPLAYRRVVEIEAARQGLPDWFLYSIMRIESRYKRGAVSWADAMGLMQLIPPTAREVARLEGLPFLPDQVFLPEWNIKLSAAYLGRISRDFKGQLGLVAAGYNAGPNPIRTFILRWKGERIDRVVDGIAYNGARDYSRQVASHALHYVLLYGGEEERRQVLDRLFPEDVDFRLGNQVQF